MTHKIILLFFILFVFTITAGLQAEKKHIAIPIKVESNKNAKASYDKALLKWKALGVENYTIKVNYGAFSPVSGVWEIDVKSGSVTGWRFKGTENAEKYRQFASRLTMEKLFASAQSSFSNKKDSPSHIAAVYDETDGHVKTIMRMKNPSFKGEPPKDNTYRCEVISIVIHKN